MAKHSPITVSWNTLCAATQVCNRNQRPTNTPFFLKAPHCSQPSSGGVLLSLSSAFQLPFRVPSAVGCTRGGAAAFIRTHTHTHTYCQHLVRCVCVAILTSFNVDDAPVACFVAASVTQVLQHCSPLPVMCMLPGAV